MSRRVVDFRPRPAASAGATIEPTSGIAGSDRDAERPRRRRAPRRAKGLERAAADAAAALGTTASVPGDIARDLDPQVGVERPRRRARRARRDDRSAHDRFADRLRELELELDQALARAGGSMDPSVVMRARGAAEEVVSFYADLARAFGRGGLEELFVRLRMIGTAEEVDEFGYDPAFRAQIAPMLRFLYDRWWRVELIGAENVPMTGRVLLVANHAGAMFPYDALMLAHAMAAHHPGGGRELRPLVEDFVYHFPFAGPLLARAGMVRASQENADRLLAREAAVAVFPEGGKGLGKYYRDRYRLQRFGRGGFVTLAMRTAAPLVPVAIIGSEEVHPVIAKWQWLARVLDLPYFPVTPTFPWLGLGGLIPLPTKWRVIFGAPLDLAAEYGPGAHEDDLLVNRVKEQVRDRIQRMVIDGLRARDSVFTG